MSVDIVLPAALPDIPAVLTNGGPAGVVCVKVDANSSNAAARAAEEDDDEDPDALNVWVKVYAGHLEGGDPAVPATHPADADVAVHEVANRWIAARANCPATAASPGADVTAVAWAEFPAGTGGTHEVRSLFVQFQAVPAARTQCEGSGSGAMGARAQASYRGSALSIAPLLWTLLAEGFGGPLSGFNGLWALALQAPGGGVCGWDNGGDGKGVPHVSLRCESPLAKTWTLTLRNGGPSAEYTRPATGWNPLGPNVLTRSAGDGPDTLTVTPG